MSRICDKYSNSKGGTIVKVREFHSLDPVESRLLDAWQRSFPLVARPFRQIADGLQISEYRVLDLLSGFLSEGVVSRVGPVFRPNTVGVSILAAVAIEGEAELLEVAAIINQFEEVNHNYEREDTFNLWFVVTAADSAKLDKVLDTIERRTGRVLLRLPLLRDYHIDLGFSMRSIIDSPESCESLIESIQIRQKDDPVDKATLQSLVRAVQGGFPLVPRPYLAIGKKLGWSEKRVMDQLALLLRQGIIKRLGVVVRHHELGFSANAMVVWDIPDALLDTIGESLSQQTRVTLCYHRPRVEGRWPYNLFSMVHGRNRHEVLQQVDRLTRICGEGVRSRKVLFSARRFKQRGARYCGTYPSDSMPELEMRSNG